MEQSLKNNFLPRPAPARESSREHSLYFDATHDCVVSEWQGFVSKQSLVVGEMKSLKLLKQSQCPNLLVDHLQVHGTWADLSDWQQHIWLPNALQAGLKKYALVACTGSYSALSLELIFEKLDRKLELMLFSDLREAKNWLVGF